MSKHHTALKKEVEVPHLNIVEKLQDRAEQAREYIDTARDYVHTGSKQARQVMRKTEQSVKRYPFRAIAISTLAGFLIGRLFSRSN